MCNCFYDLMKLGGAILFMGAALGAIFFMLTREGRKERNVKRKAKRALMAVEDMMRDVHDIFKKD